MDVRDLVRGHYGGRNLSQTILRALADAGVDTDSLQPAQLFPLDQLHAGGAPSTQHTLDALGLASGQRVLDVGCGIGGASRMAAMSGAQVTGIDLTPEFVDAATALSAKVGLDGQVRFLTTPGESLPFEDQSFDAAFMIHVGMNIPDKLAVFAEVHRALVPGGRFALYEQMRVADGDLPYPLPWADDELSSFVESSDDYLAHLEAAGFTVDKVEDRTAPTLAPPPRGPISNTVVLGAAFLERVGNNVQATRAGLLGAILVISRA